MQELRPMSVKRREKATHQNWKFVARVNWKNELLFILGDLGQEAILTFGDLTELH